MKLKGTRVALGNTESSIRANPRERKGVSLKSKSSGDNDSRCLCECNLQNIRRNLLANRADNLLAYMGRASTDPQGTQTIATSLGITRRAVQKRLKRAREADQSQPALPTLEAHTAPFTLLPTIAPMKNPPQACRILWSEAAGRASATEKMVSRRLREALVAGDMPTARLMAGALREIVMTIARLEEEAIRWNHGQKWLNDVPLKTIYSEDKY